MPGRGVAVRGVGARQRRRPGAGQGSAAAAAAPGLPRLPAAASDRDPGRAAPGLRCGLPGRGVPRCARGVAAVAAAEVAPALTKGEGGLRGPGFTVRRVP